MSKLNKQFHEKIIINSEIDMPEEKTFEEILEEDKNLLSRLIGDDDPEQAHGIADNILCEILCELGFQEIVELYSKVPKWYA